jgi:hypothetical protein
MQLKASLRWLAACHQLVLQPGWPWQVLHSALAQRHMLSTTQFRACAQRRALAHQLVSYFSHCSLPTSGERVTLTPYRWGASTTWSL